MIDPALDQTLTAQSCYDARYQAGTFGEPVRGTPNSRDCARWFDASFTAGRRIMTY